MSSLPKTREQVKADLSYKGQTIQGWAKAHGFSPSTVRRVIGGRSLNQYGDCHKIAVLLGMKNGEITND